MSEMSGIVRGLTDAVQKDMDARAASSGGSFGWFKLADKERARVRFLFTNEQDPNLVAVYEHQFAKGQRSTPPFNVTCIGKENGCPMCENGNKNRLQVYLILWNYDAKPDDQQVTRNIQVWKRGSRDVATILANMQEYGEMNSRDYTIMRSGSGMQNTSYTYMAKDKSAISADVQKAVDEQLPGVVEGILKMVELKTIDEIKTLMAGGSLKQEDVKPTQAPAGYDPTKPDQIPF